MAATADDTDDGADLAGLVLALIGSRQSVMPKRLRAPGPDDAQLRQMVDAAACAPDHRGLRPWRLVRIADHQRAALANLFEACTRDRDPAATPDDIAAGVVGLPPPTSVSFRLIEHWLRDMAPGASPR